MPILRKDGKSFVSVVKKCHTGLLEVLWSCRSSCYYTPPTVRSGNKEKKSFRASNVYCEIVKKWMSLQDVKRRGDLASADPVAAAKYLEHFKTIIDGMDYLPQQDFNLDVTSQFRKKVYRIHLCSRTKIFLRGLKISSVIALLGIL
jgi:hypothetical protein